MNRFLNRHRALRAVPLSVKYIKKLKKRIKKEPSKAGKISAEHLKEDGRFVVRSMQLQFFKKKTSRC